MTRLRAFAIHLSISIIIFLSFLGIMWFIWYPSPYYETDGGWIVVRILVGVDVVIGPLLTLILFKSGKPGLIFDMSCVILLQLGALIYGGTIVYQQRLAFVVFGIDRFTTISASEVDYAQLKDPELKRRFGNGPLLAQIRFPEDPKQRQELMFSVVLEGQKDLDFRAEFYEPYQPDLAQLRSRSIDLDKIAALDQNAKATIAAFLAQQGGQMDDYLYFPLKGKNKDMVMALSARDGMPAGFISINPWLSEYPRKPQ